MKVRVTGIISETCMFHIINQILILRKNNLSKHKIQFLNDDFVY